MVRMGVWVFCLTLVAAGRAAAASVPPVILDAGAWAQVRSTASVPRLAGLNALIKSFDERPKERIVIRYREGEAGSRWAAELRVWLAALGVPGARIELRSGALSADELELSLKTEESENMHRE